MKDGNFDEHILDNIKDKNLKKISDELKGL